MNAAQVFEFLEHVFVIPRGFHRRPDRRFKARDEAGARCYVCPGGTGMAHEERNSRSWIHGLECACGCRGLRWHGSHGVSIGGDVTIGRPARLYKADERGAKAAKHATEPVCGPISIASSLAIPGTFPGDERLDEPFEQAPSNPH